MASIGFRLTEPLTRIPYDSRHLTLDAAAGCRYQAASSFRARSRCRAPIRDPKDDPACPAAAN